jgi:hypothetical protein
MHMPKSRIYCLFCLAGILAGSAKAWSQQDLSDQELGRNLRVSLMTIGPGEEVYEKFGHNAIVIEDVARGTSQQPAGIAFNYGMFQFDEQFLPHFIQGDMRYWAEAFDYLWMVAYYEKTENRSIWMQELNLTAAQRGGLARYLTAHSKFGEHNFSPASVPLAYLLLANAPKAPEGVYYTYNYYTSNCSTKVRDALDASLGWEIKTQLLPKQTGTTYRWHTRRIMSYSIGYYTALDFVLGHEVDKPISAWEESFLPMEFQRHLRGVTVGDESGKRVPLVTREWTVYTSTRPALATAPPRWLGGYLLAGLLIGAALVGLSRGKNRWARRGFVALGMAWSLLIGWGGVFLAYAFTTSHWAVHWNENILQFSPLALPLMVLIPVAAMGKGRVQWKLGSMIGAVAVLCLIALAVPISSPAIRALWVPLGVGLAISALSLLPGERQARWTAIILCAIVAFASLTGLAAKVLPGFYQVNVEMIALVLPANLGLMLGVWRILGRRVDSMSKPELKKGTA